MSKGTRKSTMNKRRRGFLSVFLPWARRFGLGAIGAVGLVWLGSFLYMNGTIARGKDWVDNEVLRVTSSMGFTVKNILVEGRVHTDPEMLLAIVNVGKGEPLFSFNPRAAQELVEQVGWVDTARVERRLPDTIYIGLKEHTPLALWKTPSGIKLLNERGEVIATNHGERFANLVTVIGEGAPARAPALLEILKAEPLVLQAVRGASRVSDRRWDLVLKNGVIVKLPENDVGLALRRLAEAQEQSAVLTKDVESIDLREAGRLIVKAKLGEAQEYKASFEGEPKTGKSI